MDAVSIGGTGFAFACHSSMRWRNVCSTMRHESKCRPFRWYWAMPVFRWRESWEPLRDLERQVDRLLEGLPFPFPVIRFERQYPAVNLYELDAEYLLTAELPGTSADDLELTVSAGVLTLKGTRPAPTGVADEQFRRHERVWGNWERALSVPERVQEDKVSAEFADGILKIHLPKAAEAKPRQIQVAQGNSP
jgi:HSP20 family protein